MRNRLILAAFAFIAVAAVALSRPSGPEASAPSREINLAGSQEAQAPVVSALEAGRPAELTRAATSARGAEQRSGRRVAAQTAHQHALAAIEVAPEVRTTSLTITPSTGMEAAPMAAAIPEPAPASTPYTERAYAPRFYTGEAVPQTRGPAILIRGGMGRVDDDCDLHRGNRFGARNTGGIAINRMTPGIR